MLVKSRYEADTVAAITHESVRLAARTVALHVYRVICERDEIIIPRHIDDYQKVVVISRVSFRYVDLRDKVVRIKRSFPSATYPRPSGES